MTRDEGNNRPPSASDVSQLAEHLFRHEAGKLVSVLTGIFGIDRLQLAEDVVQEALVRALQIWPYYGVPRNPAAWLTQAAKNLALDAIRREKTFHDKQREIIALMEQDAGNATGRDATSCKAEIKDDRLRMMFVCCHPRLPLEDQVALTLKTLCGFSPAEIARAFLTTEAAVAKRLTRAKQRIREARIPFAIPEGEELAQRLESVLQCLYLLFNEGYKATRGDALVREDVCQDAIRLTRLLVDHPAGNRPKTHALLALLLLNTARLDARVDGEGNLLRLQEQDRSRWHQSYIAQGMYHLAKSADGHEVSEYHLHAGIAACHCVAPDYASTDWARILQLYDQLLELAESPVVALNRAVAVAEVHGARAGIDAVRTIRGSRSLESYYLLHAVLGEFEARLTNARSALSHFRRALQLADIETERRFLLKRIQECEAHRAQLMTA